MSSRQLPHKLVAAASILIMSLSGCAGSDQRGSEQSPTEQTAGQAALSNLNEAERLRDRIARSEAAVRKSAEVLAALATQCDGCADALTYAADTAGERLRVTGGLWDPWVDVDSTAQSDLPRLPEIGDAPATPAALAGYMQATATEQLGDLQQIGDIDPVDRLLLSSILTGRLLGARYLASTFMVEATAAADLLPPGATASSPIDFPTGDAPAPAPPGTQSTADANSTSELLLFATHSYDCIGSSLGLSDLPAENYSATQDLYDQLLARRMILNANTSSGSVARCILDFPDADSLLNELLATDLELFTSADMSISEAGLQWLLEDIDTAAELGGLSTLTPGLQLGEALEED